MKNILMIVGMVYFTGVMISVSSGEDTGASIAWPIILVIRALKAIREEAKS